MKMGSGFDDGDVVLNSLRMVSKKRRHSAGITTALVEWGR
jgi:hypothetical protein